MRVSGQHIGYTDFLLPTSFCLSVIVDINFPNRHELKIKFGVLRKKIGLIVSNEKRKSDNTQICVFGKKFFN